MIYVCGILLVFYFVPAIAVYVRLFDHGSAPYFLQFIILLPLKGYYVVFKVLDGVFERISSEKVIKEKGLILNYLIALGVWKTFISVMLATVGMIIIENSNEVKHQYKRASNHYCEMLITIMAQECCHRSACRVVSK